MAILIWNILIAMYIRKVELKNYYYDIILNWDENKAI